MNSGHATRLPPRNRSRIGRTTGNYLTQPIYMGRHRIIVIVGLTFSGSSTLKEESTMNGPDPMGIARQRLSEAISNFQAPTCDPLNVSPWIAMSLLQKAIRRGQEQLALQAASTLLRVSPERLWRRCGCVAFEDVGVADLDTVAIVTASLAGKRIRATLGGEWRAASYIVTRMVHAPKCRAADDLLLAAENHPAYERARFDFASRTTADLIGIATGSAPLPIRALALWYGIGTACSVPGRLPAIIFRIASERGQST
jgi:hypothetical protein